MEYVNGTLCDAAENYGQDMVGYVSASLDEHDLYEDMLNHAHYSTEYGVRRTGRCQLSKGTAAQYRVRTRKQLYRP